MAVIKRRRFVLIGALFWLIPLALTALVRVAGSEGARVDHISQEADAIPSEPPRADRISFGPLNSLGESTVTGAPGAVLPSAHVLLINLDTTHQDYVMAAADGSFSAQIFAPPGSNIMVKHGPDHRFWNGTDQGATEPGYTIFPSTTIYRPPTHGGGPGVLPFAAAGAMDIVDTRPSSVGAAWSMTGTVGPVDNLHPGDVITIESTIRLYSQAITASTDVATITLQLDPESAWLMLYDAAGAPLPYMNQAGSNRLTPSGFPILDSRRPEVRSPLSWTPVNWEYKGGHMIEGTVSISTTVDAELPPGIYRPVLSLAIDGVPSGTGWRSALVSWQAGLPSFKFNSSGVGLPLLRVQAPTTAANPATETNPSLRLIWYLQMDNASLGTRGTGAVEDREIFQPSSFVATQGAPYVLSPVDPYSGAPAVYRMEPYLPLISYGRGAAPAPPLIPFVLPGGELCVTIHEPDGAQRDLGCDPFAQSVSGDRSTEFGELLNFGAIEVSEYFGLTTANEAFAVSFSKPGYHVIEMNGWIEDVWGNHYEGGGTYELWVAYPLDLDPGLLPGTPLAVGDPINLGLQLNPRLPAYVNLVVRHYPYSDPALMELYVIEGWANRFGTFVPGGPPITLDDPGEYRLDLFAEYVDPLSGGTYAAGATWGGVVMTPPGVAQLVAHGRRGSDNHSAIPSAWFVFCDPQLQPPLVEDAAPHLYNAYLNGDMLWAFDIFLNDVPECLGDALLMNASIQDRIGTVESAIVERYQRAYYPLAPPGSFQDRVLAQSLPLFSSTTTGRPLSMYPEAADQIAYAYLSSQRAGVRVRETVSEDGQGSGYWRLDQMYDNQPGAGFEGDLPNDFKFQFIGVVYRDLKSGLSEYLGQGSGWVHLPYSDTVGTRLMPPFPDEGNGGWPTTGGPILTLKGEEIDMFLLPTGVRPGAILQVGDTFDFAGHVMPTLNSRVEVEVVAPSGNTRIVSGRANPVGYFYKPEDGFVVDEPGLWTANVTIWHDGQIGSGEFVNCDPANPFDPTLPCPSGNILGSANGSYAFYVVAPDSPRLTVTSPAPGQLAFGDQVTPIEVSGPLPPGVTNAAVDYTISMPGFILEQGPAQIGDGQFSLIFDPAGLHADFPNLDLTGIHGDVAGLSDTFSFGLLLSGEQGGAPLYRATTLTIQADHLYVENAVDVGPFQHWVYLPSVVAAD